MINTITFLSFKAAYSFTIIKWYIEMLKYRHFTLRGVLY